MTMAKSDKIVQHCGLLLREDIKVDISVLQQITQDYKFKIKNISPLEIECESPTVHNIIECLNHLTLACGHSEDDIRDTDVRNGSGSLLKSTPSSTERSQINSESSRKCSNQASSSQQDPFNYFLSVSLGDKKISTEQEKVSDFKNVGEVGGESESLIIIDPPNDYQNDEIEEPTEVVRSLEDFLYPENDTSSDECLKTSNSTEMLLGNRKLQFDNEGKKEKAVMNEQICNLTPECSEESKSDKQESNERNAEFKGHTNFTSVSNSTRSMTSKTTETRKSDDTMAVGKEKEESDDEIERPMHVDSDDVADGAKAGTLDITLGDKNEGEEQQREGLRKYPVNDLSNENVLTQQCTVDHVSVNKNSLRENVGSKEGGDDFNNSDNGDNRYHVDDLMQESKTPPQNDLKDFHQAENKISSVSTSKVHKQEEGKEQDKESNMAAFSTYQEGTTEEREKEERKQLKKRGNPSEIASEKTVQKVCEADVDEILSGENKSKTQVEVDKDDLSSAIGDVNNAKAKAYQINKTEFGFVRSVQAETDQIRKMEKLQKLKTCKNKDRRQLSCDEENDVHGVHADPDQNHEMKKLQKMKTRKTDDRRELSCLEEDDVRSVQAEPDQIRKEEKLQKVKTHKQEVSREVSCEDEGDGHSFNAENDQIHKAEKLFVTETHKNDVSREVFHDQEGSSSSDDDEYEKLTYRMKIDQFRYAKYYFKHSSFKNLFDSCEVTKTDSTFFLKNSLENKKFVSWLNNFRVVPLRLNDEEKTQCRDSSFFSKFPDVKTLIREEDVILMGQKDEVVKAKKSLVSFLGGSSDKSMWSSTVMPTTSMIDNERGGNSSAGPKGAESSYHGKTSDTRGKRESQAPQNLYCDSGNLSRELQKPKDMKQTNQQWYSGERDINAHGAGHRLPDIPKAPHAERPTGPPVYRSHLNPFTVYIHNHSIIEMKVDVIVNAANRKLKHGGGVAKVIAQAAGRALVNECEEHIRRHDSIKVTDNFVSTGGNLPTRYVMHAVGPRWDAYGDNGPEKQQCLTDLRRTVLWCLMKANKEGLSSIALPSISAAIFKVPKDLCAECYLAAVKHFDLYAIMNQTCSLKEIHFVDVDDTMVNHIQEEFMNHWEDSVREESMLRDVAALETLEGNLHSGRPSSRSPVSASVAVTARHNLRQDPTKKSSIVGKQEQIKSSAFYRIEKIEICFSTKHAFDHGADLVVVVGKPFDKLSGLQGFKVKDHIKTCSSKPKMKDTYSYSEVSKPGSKRLICSVGKEDLSSDNITRACQSISFPIESDKPKAIVISSGILYPGKKTNMDVKLVGKLFQCLYDFFIKRDLSPMCVFITASEDAAPQFFKVFESRNVEKSSYEDFKKLKHGGSQGGASGASGFRRTASPFRGGGPGSAKPVGNSQGAISKTGSFGSSAEQRIEKKQTDQPRGRQSAKENDGGRSTQTSGGNYTSQLYPDLSSASASSSSDQRTDRHKDSRSGLPKISQSSDEDKEDKSKVAPGSYPGHGSQGHVSSCKICAENFGDVIPVLLPCCKKRICESCRDQMQRCPYCTQIFGILTGNQPLGTMRITLDYKQHAAGYEKYGVFIIHYEFSHGTQGKDHPNPGQYYARTSRTAYLPASDDGHQYLYLLALAFLRRLTFTIDTSATTGKDGIVWNGIHHKTSLNGGTYGYPDPEYMARLHYELVANGVTKKSTCDEERSKIELSLSGLYKFGTCFFVA